jgi:hypothetical protein
MPAPAQPRLRRTITGQLHPQDPGTVLLYDTTRISRHILHVSREAVGLLELFDGRYTLAEIHATLLRNNIRVQLELLHHFTDTLDEACFLEGPRLEEKFAAFRAAPVREPTCIGTYAGDPDELRQQLDSLFADPRGAGWPEKLPHPTGKLGGALIPHIDYQRGGTTYTWGFRELIEHSDANLFVIIATSHYSPHRFILTRKHFQTPLGIAETNQAYVQRLAEIVGPSVFADEPAHLPEHSIELHVVFLQYCMEKLGRPFQIVPLLVGSFHDCIRDGIAPHEKADIHLMIRALKTASQEAAAAGAKICYLSSGDLAHIGPKFGDDGPVMEPFLGHSDAQDHALLEQLEAVNNHGFFRVLADENDDRRICGFPPTSLLLSVLEPKEGKLLDYQQYVEPRGYESVSFASVGFYK